MNSSPINVLPVSTILPDQGQTVSVVGDTYRIILDGEQTNGSFAVIDMLIPPGGGPGPHSHAGIEESFYVVEGEVAVNSETQNYTARKGTFVHIPFGGPVHNFKNVSQHPAHLLCTVQPAGLEAMFREIGQPVAAGEFLPPPDLSPEDLKKLTVIAEKYGQKLYPPDYLG
jgi:quercetin dioxygenase-like cupin family protein